MTPRPPETRSPETQLGRRFALRSIRLDTGASIAVVVFLVYLVSARFVGSFFPLSTFDMYSKHVSPTISNMVVLEEGGEAVRFGLYEAFHCEPASPSFEEAMRECGITSGVVTYRVRDMQQYFDEHQANVPGSRAVRISARTYDLSASGQGPPPSSDCVIATCTAELRQ